MGCCSCLRNVSKCWRSYVLVITPFLLLPLLTNGAASPENKCAYVVLLMAVYWMTEAMPIAVTSLLPVVLFPLFGIMSTDHACIQYLKETNMMFIGGLMVAIAVESCGLHTRIALRVLLTIGTSTKRLIFGFMMTTMFLSMWISNTATTAMMMPIVEAVLEELFRIDTELNNVDSKKNGTVVDDTKQNGGKGIYTVPTCETTLYDSNDGLAENGQIEWEPSKGTASNGKLRASSEIVDFHEADPEYESKVDAEKKLFRKTVTLSVAYAANVGGTGTMSGSGPNLVLKGMVSQLYGTQTGLNFATWMLFCVPTMLLCVVGAWAWLVFLYTCRRPDTEEKDNSQYVMHTLRNKYKELGSFTFHEIAILVFFVILIFLWFFREPQFIPGWADLFPVVEVDDATAAMFISVLLFTIPSRIDFWCFRSKGQPDKPIPALLEWSVVQKKMPWGIVLLMGGGFSMAEATKVSGLSHWVGQQLIPLNVLPAPAIVCVVCVMTAVITEVTSNVAAATVLLPVLANLAQSLGIHPLYLMLPATITCSYAFMLPIATPPNAIAFTSGKMKSEDMLFPGLFMNLLCVGVITLMINTLGVVIFDLNSFPDWAMSPNTTAIRTPEMVSLNTTLSSVT